jgi:flagellar protein FliS
MMTSFHRGARAYAQVGVETGVVAASPHRLIQMLLDGAVVAITQAREAMLARDIARKGELTSRAIDIIQNGLRASLDHSAGGELAGQLENLYSYMASRLLVGSAQNRTEPLEEVVRLLGELRTAWAAIAPEMEQRS